MPPSDRELWIAANMVLRRHGREAPRFVAGRVGALAMQDDEAGVEAWRAIARRIDALRADQPEGAAH